MFERFTSEAREVVVHAQEEARETFRHNFIGTEHILLGVLRGNDTAATRTLDALGVRLEPVREAIGRVVGPSPEAPGGQIPFTPRAKKVLELSLREAMNLGHNYIGAEHILLGITEEAEGVAARVLGEAGADAEKIREEVIRQLSGPGVRPRYQQPPPGAGRAVHHPLDPIWLEGLHPFLTSLTDEIRRELGRDPDTGDLLLALANAPDATGGRVLSELGLDMDMLWGKIELSRREQAKAREDLSRQLQEVRAKKETAIGNQRFQEAAGLRDQERELVQRLNRSGWPPRDARREVRRLLGLPAPPTDPASG